MPSPCRWTATSPTHAAPKVVFSHTLESVDWNSRLERGDPVEVVTKLKAETDGRLEVAGATLAAPIVQAVWWTSSRS